MKKKYTRVIRAKPKSKVSRTAARKAAQISTKINIYKVGTKAYYRDALNLISSFTVDYDGFTTVKGLKSLIDDIKELANKALEHKELYLSLK